ncbi:alkaline phosphatase family protein [Saccharopolyspora rosea]|uniref:Sulfatase n=1 Tax=Saccharopolyspora rosea TaxID=524884 RepID=A0ABW3FU68_9PSEU|nr:hypothetical protein [Saccharopolyspora rosea]
MRAIMLMFDSLNRHMLPPYGGTFVQAPNFQRLARRSVVFDNFRAGSLPCIPARRELHTTPDIQGHDLAQILDHDGEIRSGALFDIHGGHVNVTDGRYVYMRSCTGPANAPLEEHTLMPTHMRSRFDPDELAEWQPCEPFSFTKGLRTMRIPTSAGWLSSWRHGTLLFDLREDAHQQQPLDDPDVELRMLHLLTSLLRESDAPTSQFERLDLPHDRAPGPEHLLVAEHAARAAEIAEPLPREQDLPPAATTPVGELLGNNAARAALERHLPEICRTETLGLPPTTTLLDLARHAVISAATLRALADELG